MKRDEVLGEIRARSMPTMRVFDAVSALYTERDALLTVRETLKRECEALKAELSAAKAEPAIVAFGDKRVPLSAESLYKTLAELSRLTAEHDALKAKFEALRTDAARYRWILVNATPAQMQMIMDRRGDISGQSKVCDVGMAALATARQA